MIKGNKDRMGEEGEGTGRGVSPGCATPRWGLIEGLTAEAAAAAEVRAALQPVGGPPAPP